MIWEGRMNEPGGIDSRREPTAEKARMVWTPRDFRAAMLAREGTEEGGRVWEGPWRAMKAMWKPEGREEIVIGEEG
jgi:hypothetical protein